MEMKERQRWSAEEDTLLRNYVKLYGPQEWHLVSQRMNVPLHRDAKSCLERWKNYLKPGIKKGSLTEEEQRLVIRLQAKHGNKWKKIAAEVPGRTAKRLGKWWEVYKEKQQREENKERSSINHTIDPIEERKYDTILENFAEKLVKERAGPTLLMTAPPQMLPPWLSNEPQPPRSPSVTLSLSSPTVVSGPPAPAVVPPTSMTWLQLERGPPPPLPLPQNNMMVYGELVESCRELEEGQRAWAAHRKEAAWRLKRVELQLESEKSCKRREKMEEIEAKIKALREEQQMAMDRIEADYREQLAGLRRDAEAKEQKLAEQWASKHMRLTKFLEQMGCPH